MAHIIMACVGMAYANIAYTVIAYIVLAKPARFAPDRVLMVYFDFSVFVSRLPPHTWSKNTPPQTPFLYPKNHFLTNKRKKTQIQKCLRTHDVLSHDEGDCQTACLYPK